MMTVIKWVCHGGVGESYGPTPELWTVDLETGERTFIKRGYFAELSIHAYHLSAL